MKKQKLLRLLLSVVVLLSVLPLAGMASPEAAPAAQARSPAEYEAQGFQPLSDGLYWKLEGRRLTIGGVGEMEDYSFENRPPWDVAPMDITVLVIEEGVRSIGTRAFDGCGLLSTADLPESLVSIGSAAFEGCTNLTDLHLPAGITSIGESAFRDRNY